MIHKFPYKWELDKTQFHPTRGKVFSCFACGGGSSMGYKLAGYDVLGCCEIDPRVNQLYVDNLHPHLNYLMDIRELVTRAEAQDLPPELYKLDILDGSPPCTTFSIVGKREAGWGKAKKFREGQVKQVLDTLSFDFIRLAEALHPRVIVMENVPGIIQRRARKYWEQIMMDLDRAGYVAGSWMLKAASMGVPQLRERCIFVAVRKDMAQYVATRGLLVKYLNIDMTFSEPPILWDEVYEPGAIARGVLGPAMRQIWEQRQPSDIGPEVTLKRMGHKPAYYSYKYLRRGHVANTITASDSCVVYDEGRYRSDRETMLCGSWPLDYDFKGQSPSYVIGMSVPPVMMANIADRVWEQVLSRLPVDKV